MTGSANHNGETFKIYYYNIGSFEDDLKGFGAFLESLEKTGDRVMDIVANTGLVGSSVVVGSGFTGVKGFAVVVRLSNTRATLKSSSSEWFLRGDI